MISNDSSIIDKTLPEIFVKEYAEVFLTKWLAYVLKITPELVQKIYNSTKNSGNKELSNLEVGDYIVYDEYPLPNNGGRIDLYIESKDEKKPFTIAIENKVGAWESGVGQLTKYSDSIGDDSSVVKILLLPDYNKLSHDSFTRITYGCIGKFIDEILNEEKKEHTPNKLFHLHDLKKHIESKLYQEPPIKIIEKIIKVRTEEKDDLEVEKKLAVSVLEYIRSEMEKIKLDNTSLSRDFATGILQSSRMDYIQLFDKKWIPEGTNKDKAPNVHFELKFLDTSTTKIVVEKCIFRLDFEERVDYRDALAEDFIETQLSNKKNGDLNFCGDIVEPINVGVEGKYKHLVKLSKEYTLDFSNIDSFEKNVSSMITSVTNILEKYISYVDDYYNSNNDE